MKHTVRPRLKRGARVAVVSPASIVKPELVEAGIARLKAHGYEPVLMPHALARGPLNYAGSAEERAADLQAAFADDAIDGVLCTRGGWGSVELLPLLDRELMRAHAKVFVGYSDHTSLHMWMWNECGLPTVYGPMVASDWSKEDGVEERTWRAVVDGEGAWSVGAADGVRVLKEGAAVEGRLLGGCLAMVTEALGTPWALKIDEPCVLFLEDINVHPYQWDRMLQHLKFAGALELVQGIVLGDMEACGGKAEAEAIDAACRHALKDFRGPVAIGYQSGHVDRVNRTTPLGAWVRMEGDTVREVGTES